VRRSVFVVVFAVLGLSVTSWAGSPNGAAPSATATPEPAPASISTPSVMENLLNLMVTKGVLTSAEAVQLRGLPAGQQVAPLLSILAKKGVLTQEDLASLNVATPAYSSSLAVAPGLSVEPSAQGPPAAAQPSPTAAQAPPKPPAPTVVAAVAPLRVLPIDTPKREGLIPDLKVGPVRLKPYGFIKMSLVHDSSVPRGNDFPLPFFLFGDTGPSGSPEFHIKARSTRLGTNFEWLDLAPKLTVTGKVEMDFEGNYTATDNRNISSYRSSQMSIRLAYGRLDYALSDKASVFGVFGQDWTLFGSSTLPNTLETTGLGLGFGSIYERDPQARGGFVYSFGSKHSTKLSTEFAAVMPTFGNTPGSTNFQIPGPNPGQNVFNVLSPTGAVIGTVTVPQTANTGNGLALQLATGERQGADSDKPEVEGRVALQFQLDHAPGVAPAQLIVAGVNSYRKAIVISTAVPTAFKAAFPTGVETDSQRYGINFQAQLPTRFATFLASWYRGADLRFFFAGQLFSHYNNTSGLTGTASAATIDGSDLVVFGNSGGVATTAAQDPVRAVGGFVEVGLPLSRWFNARPTSRMAGWSANLHYSTDQVIANDLYRLTTAGSRARSYWYFGNIMYKLNTWVTLGFEEGRFSTIAIPSTTGVFPVYKGVPTREAIDYRSEFSTIFTF
jgi:hypothetical protein